MAAGAFFVCWTFARDLKKKTIFYVHEFGTIYDIHTQSSLLTIAIYAIYSIFLMVLLSSDGYYLAGGIALPSLVAIMSIVSACPVSRRYKEEEAARRKDKIQNKISNRNKNKISSDPSWSLFNKLLVWGCSLVVFLVANFLFLLPEALVIIIYLIAPFIPFFIIVSHYKKIMFETNTEIERIKSKKVIKK